MSDRARKVPERSTFGVRPGTLRIGTSPRIRRLRRVLVVDDDPVVRQVVATILSTRGYDVVVRGEALGTLAVIAREQPDIVVLDVNMPGLSGDALARLVSNRAGKAPQVILHSSQPHGELARLAQEAGALGAIEKGDPRDFLEAFEALVG
ncbi:MAG: response regulator [Myxococcales bacterium]